MSANLSEVLAQAQQRAETFKARSHKEASQNGVQWTALFYLTHVIKQLGEAPEHLRLVDEHLKELDFTPSEKAAWQYLRSFLEN
jgi:hypothetical protein